MLEPIKRIEVITDFVFVTKFTQKFDEIGLKGYSIIKDVIGKGSSGNVDGHGVMAGTKNCYILICCEPLELKNIQESIVPLIKKYGGMCLVSDGQWIVHK